MVQAPPLCQHLLAPGVDGGVDTLGWIPLLPTLVA